MARRTIGRDRKSFHHEMRKEEGLGSFLTTWKISGHYLGLYENTIWQENAALLLDFMNVKSRPLFLEMLLGIHGYKRLSF